MKRIVNWTFGAFFRSIGRTLAFIFLGLLIAWLVAKFDIKLPFISYAKALELKNKYTVTDSYVQNCTIKLPNSQSTCNSIITNNPKGSINLYEDYLKMQDYYYIYQSTNDGTTNNPYYYIYTYSDPFYVFISYSGNVLGENRYDITAYTVKIAVTESVYNSLIEQGKIRQTYHDIQNNKYYYFENGEGVAMKYRINTNSWGDNPVNYDISHFLAMTEGVEVYYYRNSSNPNTKMYDILTNNIESYEVTFHLNGGTATIVTDPDFIGPPQAYYNEFTRTFNSQNELVSFINNLQVTNDVATFNNWYYDQALTQPFNVNGTLTSNTNLYASYEYTSVDSIISNVSFTEYTFEAPNDIYEYAVISVKENFNQGLYIGLGFNFQFLDVYNYEIQNQAFTNGSFFTLQSIGSKNNRYYYHIGQLDNMSAKVIVLDKANLVKLGVNNEIEHYYTFWVSNNCYVYFTNDLTQISYYIPDSGGTSQKLENIDISTNYDYTQQFILDSNTDLASILLGLVDEADFSIFDLFKNTWYKFRSYKIFNYFLLITIGGIVVALIKGGSRH